MASPSDLHLTPRFALLSGLIGLGTLFLLRFLWPLVILLGIPALGIWLWQKHQHQQQLLQHRHARLNRKFYDLLRQRRGRVSALELAMYTRLSGTDARRYLHRQAQALGAYFERTVNGDIIYIFNVAGRPGQFVGPQMTPAEIAWAYAERAQEAKTLRQHQIAWANARQIRTLRQLSDNQPVSQANSATSRMLSPVERSQPQNKIGLNADLPHQSNIARGRANRAPQQIITIDVPAVNG
ncbi:MAG: hypothetical protein AAFP20_03910 [Cyanobacteria bacterium J06614_10]